SGGKRLRPALVLASGKMMGAREKDLLYPATGVEILHNSTLITDDIIDKSEVRRGRPTVWKKFGRSVAECVAMDYAATVFLAANRSPYSQEITEIYSRAFKTIWSGEILDILFEQKGREDEPYIIKNRFKNVSLNSYYKMAGKKTAVLFQGCCEIGGVCARAGEKDLQTLSEYGYNLGMAFQIRDDILDIFGEEKDFGKKIGKDIKERKLGNIVIFYALKNLSPADRKKIFRILEKKEIGEREIKEGIALIKKTPAHDQAFALGKKYITKAKNNLEKLPQNNWNKILLSLTDFVIEREK
ncbi:MAG TPA: polyprenyl synthetase family protein, partial [Patescibacteria group bacterium]|nr:polyprenyl synthetase family protein [Patescibacteria group bacterium]